jgi:uncharacterized phiE125 gp8 family phage protein
MWPESVSLLDPRIGVQDHLVTAPTEEPIPAEDVLSDHLRTPNASSLELSYVIRLVRAARLMGERYTQRAFAEQTRERWLERFPPGNIWLPYPPLLEVLSVSYTDTGGTVQALTEGTDYLVTAPSGPMAGPGAVVLMPDTSWPSTRTQPDAVKVQYSCGYLAVDGSPADLEIPADLVHGMLLVIGEFYKQRSESVQGISSSRAFRTAVDLWDGYRVYLHAV